MLVRRAGGLRWSLDGQRIAYMRPDPASGDAILVARADAGDERVLFPAAPGIHAHEPAWSPVSDDIAYFTSTPSSGVQAVRQTNSRGEGRPGSVPLEIGAVEGLAFSWDGRQLAIGRSPGGSEGEILVADFAKATGRRAVRLGPFVGVRGLAWTPDDARLVYGIVHYESRIMLFEGLDLR